MTIFIQLLLKIFPFYILIALGFFASKKLDIKKESVSSIIMFIVSPPVVFLGVYNSELTKENISIPFLVVGLCSLMSLLGLKLAKAAPFRFHGNLSNTLSFLAGSVNVGYFGLPAVTTILGPQSITPVVLCIVGMAIFQSTVGMYMASRGEGSWRDSLDKILKLPIIYAFLLGFIFAFFDLNIGKTMEDFLGLFKGAYSVLGMMTVGMALEELKFKSIGLDELRFTSFALMFKFIFWPLTVALLVWLDLTYIHFFKNELILQTFLILSCVPIAANSMAYLTHLRLHPNLAALAVVASTIITLFYLPLMLNFFRF